MMIFFVGYIWLPGGFILACVELVLIPFLWISFRIVKKYGTEKNKVSAEAVSSIVEYVSGIQTFRAYGVGGTKNKTVTSDIKKFSDVSYDYEKHGIPTNAIQCIFLWLGLPIMVIAASDPMLSGKLDPVSYLLICMLPMLLAKLSDSISRGLMSYKNLRQHRTIAEASAVESPIRQETIGFPAHFFARAHNFKPPGRACQPEADSPMRT